MKDPKEYAIKANGFNIGDKVEYNSPGMKRIGVIGDINYIERWAKITFGYGAYMFCSFDYLTKIENAMSDRVDTSGFAHIKPPKNVNLVKNLEWFDIGNGGVAADSAGYGYLIHCDSGGVSLKIIRKGSDNNKPVLYLDKTRINELKEFADHHNRLFMEEFINK